ncbi:MAG: glycosyltransferase N-terminal domain-containing protein [Cyanobacteria bacterium J06638_7]
MAVRGLALLLSYRLLTLLLTPLLLLLLLLRSWRGREEPRRLPERLGVAPHPRPAGPLVWIHAASVGELTSLLPLLEALAVTCRTAGRPAPAVLVTSVTRTAARLAPSLLPQGVLHQYVPIDHCLAMALFRRHWRPDLGLLAEAELWPELVHAMPRPVLINARVSARSYRRHCRLPLYSRWLYGRCQACFAQSAADAERLRRLGAPAARALGSTKWDAPPLAVDGPSLERVRRLWCQRPVLLFASSHVGEEALLLAAWPEICRRLAPRRPALLLAPRHPQRAPQVLALVRASLPAAQLWSQLERSSAADPSAAPRARDALVVDALGMMGTWIAAAAVVVMGGSFRIGGLDIGGHNPLEPVRGGRPVVCGPDMANFAEVSAELEGGGWLRRCASADAAWETVIAWLREPPRPAALPPLQGPSALIAASVLERLPLAVPPASAR